MKNSQISRLRSRQEGFVPLVLLIIIAVVVIGGSVYYYSQKVPNTEVKTTNQATTTVQTVGWKTYSNTKYGFEFKYPQTFEVQGTDVISIAPKDYVGDGYIFTIRSSDNSYYEQFSKDAISNKISESSYILGNITAQKINAKFDFGGGINYILFPHNGKKFIIMTDLTSEQQQILSTFKFTSTSSQANTSNWKTYVNSQFGFQFSYPKGLTDLREYPHGEDCKPTIVGKGVYGDPYSPTVAAINNIAVNVYCSALKNGGSESVSIDLNTKPTMVNVAGNAAYQYEFVTATGYTWRVVQIPISSSKYAELTYTYGNSYRLNNEGYEMSITEWAEMLASFKITK